MRLFLSYRRDDTAGRAGRLFDGLTQRVGVGRVFQDVEAISPGLDFERAVSDSLGGADATVVVIGRDWATVTDADGSRRLQHEDDLVRMEVGAALRSDRPVVPVLVGGAALPRVDELPDDLQPLLKRQTFTLRDDAWNDDVDDLVRHLRTQLAQPGQRRRTRAVVVGAVAGVLVLGVVGVIALWPDADDPGGDGASTTDGSGPGTTAGSGVLPPCTVVDDDSLVPLTLAEADPVVITMADGRVVTYRAVGVAAQEREDGWRVLADIEVVNETTQAEPGMENWYVTSTDFQGIAADGTLGETATDCFNVIDGNQNLAPGAPALVVQIGFDGSTDPRGADLVVATGGNAIALATG